MPRGTSSSQAEAGPSGTQPADLDYVRRATFTQAIMQRQCLPEDEAKQIYRDLMNQSTGAPRPGSPRNTVFLAWLTS
jgi:hypothetical protein